MTKYTNLKFFLLLLVLTIPLKNKASVGFGESEEDLCENYVLSNSDIYDDRGETPVLVFIKGNNEEILLEKVYEARCIGKYIIGSFLDKKTRDINYFLLDKTSKKIEFYSDEKKFNTKILDIGIFPFYSRFYYNDTTDIFKQIDEFNFLKWTILILMGLTILIIFRVRKGISI